MKDHQTIHKDSGPVTEPDTVALERDEYLNGWKRALADFENFKRDSQNRISEARTSERIRVVRDLLPMIDTLERAIEHIPKEQRTTGWFQGLEHIRMQWEKFMQEHDVEKIDDIGVPFDPLVHEAIHTESKPEMKDQAVLSVILPGYRLDSDLIRPAQVTVNMLPGEINNK